MMYSTTQQSDSIDILGKRFDTHDAMLLRDTRKRDNLKAMVDLNNADLNDFEKAIKLCNACIDAQVDAKKYIENIASALINTVMQGVHLEAGMFGAPPEYAFILEPVEGKDGMITGLKPMISKNGIVDDPKSYGGGVQNLASFAIRLVYLLLNPSINQVLLLDEPMTNLSPKAWEFVVRFIEDLQRDLDLQVMLITHSGAEFPTTFQVSKEGDTSKVSQLRG